MNLIQNSRASEVLKQVTPDDEPDAVVSVCRYYCEGY